MVKVEPFWLWEPVCLFKQFAYLCSDPLYTDFIVYIKEDNLNFSFWEVSSKTDLLQCGM